MPDFVPDFTGYDLDQPGIDWYTMYDNMAQTPQEVLIRVVDNIYKQHLVSFRHTLRIYDICGYNKTVHVSYYGSIVHFDPPLLVQFTIKQH